MKSLLKLTFILAWGLLAAIILLGLVSHLSPSVFLLYKKIVKALFWSFWGFTLASLFLLISSQEKQIKERLRKMLTLSKEKMTAEVSRLQIEERIGAGLSGLLVLLLMIPTVVLVMESYLLIETLAYMWVIILFFTAYAIFRKFAKKYKMKEKIINTHFDFIAALGFSITILYILWLPGFFHQPFLDSARFIDNTIFSGVAKEVGDNYREIMKKDIKGINIRESSPESYTNTLEGYTQQLKNGKLKNGTLPYEFQGNKTYHTIFIDRALEFIGDRTTDKTKKQKVLDTLLNYLIRVTKKGYIEEINRQDKEHKINIIFLGKLNDLIILQNLETGKWKCFLCCIKEYTKINVSRFGIPLGKKECEPCLRD